MSARPDHGRIAGRRALVRSASVLLAATVVAAACSGGSDGGRLELGGRAYSQPELRYGLDVLPEPGVTLADDVVVIPNGSRAVRGLTGDGLTWTLDAGAPKVGDLDVGDVMFLTARGVGRVVAIEEDDGERQVTIVPVEITEVIWEGDFSGESELDPAEMVAYDTGEKEWSEDHLPPTEMEDDGLAEGEAEDGAGAEVEPPGDDPAGGGGGADEADDEAMAGGAGPTVRLASHSALGAAGGGPDSEGRSRGADPPAPVWGGIPRARVGEFQLRPFCCAGGVGVRLSYDHDGLKLNGTLAALGAKPTASWRLTIGVGKVQHASFRVHGGLGIRYAFSVGSTSGNAGNVQRRISVPGTLEMPATAGGIPFVFTLSQDLLVRTGISAKQSTFKGHGVWAYTGTYGFGYDAGKGFRLIKPSAGRVNESLLKSIDGKSAGVAAIVLGHRIQFKVGIGWSVFNVGPYAELVSSIGAYRGSDLGSPLVVCKGADLNMWVGAGIGYKLPEVVVKIVNLVLGAFKVRPIESQGSLVADTLHMTKVSADHPDHARICRRP